MMCVVTAEHQRLSRLHHCMYFTLKKANVNPSALLHGYEETTDSQRNWLVWFSGIPRDDSIINIFVHLSHEDNMPKIFI
jgi:hypothetical protein